MNRLPDWIARRLLGLAAALVLAACGPGTGGTGTGPGVSNGLADGTYGSAAEQTAPVALTVSDTRVELNLPCRRFVYEGPWRIDDRGQAELLGRWQVLVRSGSRNVLQEQSARLTLRTGEDGVLALAVTDLGGAALLQPVTLTQHQRDAPAISCLLSYSFQ